MKQRDWVFVAAKKLKTAKNEEVDGYTRASLEGFSPGGERTLMGLCT